MRHIYRQVTGFRNVDTFVLTKYRQNADEYPFSDLEIVPAEQTALLRRAYRKYIKREPPLLYRGEFETTRRILIRRDPDLLHIYFGNTGVHLLPLLELWDRPFVVSFHGVDVQTRPGERRYLVRLQRLLQVCRFALVRSQSLADRLTTIGCDPAKIRMNRTGIPVENFPFCKRLPPLNGEWRLVQACRLIEKKGLPTTLRAFAIFRDFYPNAQLILAGEGPLRGALENLVNELGLDEHVQFTGFLGQKDLLNLFKAAHVFVHPSETTLDQNQEGVPNSMLEAMATGLPVVATRHGGIPEAVRDGLSGFLVAEGDFDALAGTLVNMVDDPDRWLSVGASASRQVAESFSVREQIKALEACYFEALE
jgi:colanic acid/amylovoran biosynthesis glycosyltransferase